jgi:hypothetical protein
MPCHDPIDPFYAEQEISRLRAMVCAVAGALDQQKTLTKLLDSIDWNQAGVTRQEFDDWWSEHQMQDALRLRQEADAKHRQAIARQGNVP